MKAKKRLITGFVLGTVVASIFGIASAQTETLKPNQTFGFSGGHIVEFSYEENFDCVDQPHFDLNYNRMQAHSDSGEFQTPICQAGTQPMLDPTGGNANRTAQLFVLVPMFSLNKDRNPNDAISCPPGVRLDTLCGPALGKTLIKLFGAIPEAYKNRPLVYTDCPNPGSPPGTCTMHASTIDLGKVLVALKKLPPPVKNVFLPSPNHSHVVTNDLGTTTGAIWWEVIPVLVLDPADWPNKTGSVGITSVSDLRAAEKSGEAIQVPSNFYLFFSSHMENMGNTSQQGR